MTDRRSFIAGLAALAACAPADPAREADGRRAPEGGIGGTGIVGVLTGFGSLRINGLRVALAPGLAVESAFGPEGLDTLAPGESLTVEARGDAGALVAARVRRTEPLVGPVTRGAAGGIMVMGTEVTLDPSLAVPAPGTFVRVSGLWRDAGVVASRIAPAGSLAAAAGEIRRTAGGWRIGGTPVDPAGAALPAEGTHVTVTGIWRGGMLRAERVEVGRFLGAAGPLARLSVEGYLEPVPAAPGFAVSGLGHSFDPAARLARFAGMRALFEGAYTGAFEVATGVPLPEDPATRAEVLERIARGGGRYPAR